MEGRAGDERHDGGRRPPPAAIPRHPRRRDHASHRPLDPRAAAFGRHLVDVLRRAARTVDHRRGVRRAEAGGRRSGRAAHGQGRAVHPRLRRRRAQPGVHPAVAGALRPLVVGRPADDAARDDLPAVLVPAERLRLGVLGTADRRPADDRGHRPTVPPDRDRHRRAPHRPRARPALAGVDRRRRVPALRQGAAPIRQDRPPGPRPGAAVARHAPRRGVDRGPPGSRRFLGRHPTAVGLLDHGAAPARLLTRPPGAAQRPRRARGLHDSRTWPRRPALATPRGLPVAGLGHRARRDRPRRRGPARGRSAPGEGGRMAGR